MATLADYVTTIRSNNEVTIAILSAVGYDYILTFSDEIEYIWSKPWTRASTIFAFARYCGLCLVMINSLWGSSFLPGPTNHIQGQVTSIIADWAQMIFMAAAELAMILRVWALYNQSRVVLGTLLTLYATEIIAFVVTCVQASAHHNVIASTAQILDYSLCQGGYSIFVPTILANSAEIALGATMCLLVLIKFTREIFQTYKATKCFQLNRYLNLLVREGLIYFIVVLAYALIGMLAAVGRLPTQGWWILLPDIIQYIPPYTLVPRFILNLRKLHARDVQFGIGSHINSTFDSTWGSGYNAAASMIVFAAGRQNDELGEQQVGEIPMQERGAFTDGDTRA